MLLSVNQRGQWDVEPRPKCALCASWPRHLSLELTVNDTATRNPSVRGVPQNLWQHAGVSKKRRKKKDRHFDVYKSRSTLFLRVKVLVNYLATLHTGRWTWPWLNGRPISAVTNKEAVDIFQLERISIDEFHFTFFFSGNYSNRIDGRDAQNSERLAGKYVDEWFIVITQAHLTECKKHVQQMISSEILFAANGQKRRASTLFSVSGKNMARSRLV